MTMHDTKRRRPESESTPRRTFSVEDANRAIPLVQRIVEDIVHQYERTVELQRAAEQQEEAGTREQRSLTRSDYAAAADRLRVLVDELHDVGCELKDPRQGLLDFPAMHEDRPILLCWRLGEEQVSHWHELDAGYSGRQPITAEFQTE
ncbi:MAG: DUF2203 domain-containing protein [Phycisphaerae bacterium]